MPTTRGTTNRNARGSSYDRRRRKQRLLERDGTGEWAVCVTCPTVVDLESMTVDCIVPRCEGGKYGYSDLSNNRIQCDRCAPRQGAQIGNARRAARKVAA